MPRSYTFQEIATLVETTAPLWYLHDDEEYLPSSVDWFLRQATLVSKDGARTVLGTTAPEDNLPQQATWPLPDGFVHADYWLEVPETAYAGDLASARSYVTIRRVQPGFLDISHWFWYPANGCGTARLRTLAFDTAMVTQERVPLTTLGFHVSDWEKITIRVTDDSNNAIDSVYFAQHGGGHWYRPGQNGLLTAGTRIMALASRNGHASYPNEGEHYSAHLKTAPPDVWAKLTPSALEFWLRNDARMGRRRIDCAEHHEIVHIQSGPDGIMLTGQLPAGSEAPYYGRAAQGDGSLFLREPKWLNYPYRWGPETEQKITHELVFKALSAMSPQLMVVGAAAGGLELPLLGAAAGLLAPVFVKMEMENGKPGPKVKFTAGGVVDQEEPPEPDNLFHEAVASGAEGMVAWVEAAGRDVVGWSIAEGGEALDWTRNVTGDAADWTSGVARDTGAWFKGAVGSAGDVLDWAEDAAGDVGRALDPSRWIR